jgi:2-aminoadipate transaminase
MEMRISQRMTRPDFPGEFVDAMLNASTAPDLISFGGGFPNPIAFPVEDMEKATQQVLEEHGVQALQYHSTPGYKPLREFIAQRYRRVGVEDIDPDEVIITNGSQQVLDMVAACLVDPGDEVLMEKPAYLVALQTFHLYEPKVVSVPLTSEGIDCDALEEILKAHDPKVFYMVPTFQNPTGLTYTPAVRERAAALLAKTNTVVVEDDPYGELRFRGEGGLSFRHYLGEQCCLMGTFSKVLAPGMRVGWIVCKNELLRKKLLAYKQIMDLHTNIFSQMVLSQYLKENDLDTHTARIKALYRHQSDYMIACMDKYFPEGCSYTHPDGGMFMWATMPEGVAAVDVQNVAVKKGVLVCAGDPFYETERGVRSMRLNYTNSSDERIDRGIRILGDAIREVMGK